MSRTQTRSVNFQKLRDKGKTGTVLVKLMMACNDMQLANEASSRWKEEQPIARKYRQRGALMYFARLQMSHLHEAMDIIDTIQADAELKRLVSFCDEATKKSFNALLAYSRDGAKHRRFQQMVGRIRTNVTFHYDETGKLIDSIVSERSTRPEALMSLITRGSSAYLWYFQVADEVVDGIIVREIYKVSRDKDVRTEVDAIMAEMHSIFLAFVDFAGEFIWRFATE
jgi:hypothetical protein